MLFRSASLVFLLAAAAVSQDEGWSLDVKRTPSGETQVNARVPHLPDGGVVNVMVARIVDKPNLATRTLDDFRLDPPSAVFVKVGRDGQLKRARFVLMAPGTYEVSLAFDKGFPHTASVANLFEKGKLGTWSGSRTYLLGDTKEHLELLEASGSPVRRLIAKIEAILQKLDKPVPIEADSFGDAHDAEGIVREAERLLPETGLPGTVELVRIIADMILNYILYTPKQIAKPHGAGGGHEGDMQPHPQKPPPPLKPGQEPPKIDPTGDGVETKDLGSAPSGPGPSAPPNSEPEKPREPSAFVKRIRALLEELRWFHLRETALILMRRLNWVIGQGLSAASNEVRAVLMKDIELIARMDQTLHDDKETTGEKYRAFTTKSDSVNLRKIIQAAISAMMPKDEGAAPNPDLFNHILGELVELQPHVRNFAPSAAPAKGPKD